MKFTDLFIRRPVLAIVVNLVILIAGLQSIRSLSACASIPRSDIAVITVTTVYVGANADLVRGFITTPLERVIASADGIDYLESSSAQGVSTITVHLKLNYDTNAALTQIQAKVAQVRNDLPPEAEAPVIELETADSAVRGHVPRLLLEGPRPEPDHRLPDARRAAEALRRSAACSAPTSSATARSPCASGSSPTKMAALGISPSQVRDALAREQLPLRARPHQGLDGVGQPGRQHRPQDGRGVPAARGQAGQGHRSSGSATSPTSCSAPRTTTRTCASTARPPPSWASGCCPTRELARRHQARARRRCPDIQAQLPAGMKVGIPYDSTDVHPGRDRRGAEDAHRDAAHRRPRHLPVPGLGARGDHPGGRHPASRSSAPSSSCRWPASPSTC